MITILIEMVKYSREMMMIEMVNTTMIIVVMVRMINTVMMMIRIINGMVKLFCCWIILLIYLTRLLI